MVVFYQMITKLVGRSLGYYLNAYQDAKIAEELWQFSKGKLNKNQLSKRAKLFTSSLKEAEAAAYTYYYWNGFFDFMPARLFEKLRFVNRNKDFQAGLKIVNQFKKELKIKSDYSEFSKIILVKPIIALVFGKLHRCPCKDQKRNEIIKTMIRVQKENKKSNLDEYRKIENGQFDNLKLKTIEKMRDTGIEIKPVYKILKLASFWDDLFILLLRTRFVILRCNSCV